MLVRSSFKSRQLDLISEEIKKCKKCKVGKSGLPVSGEGNPNAQIVFIGETPGYQESQTGKPFIGRSGQFLTQLLREIGLNRKDIFITSPVKYYPIKPNESTNKKSREKSGRAPTDKEINHGKIHLLRQLEVIKPKLIVLLGRVAAKALIGRDSDLINKSHGTTLQVKDYKYFYTYHPAAAIRFPKIRALMQKDFQILSKLVHRQTAKMEPITTSATR